MGRPDLDEAARALDALVPKTATSLQEVVDALAAIRAAPPDLLGKTLAEIRDRRDEVERVLSVFDAMREPLVRAAEDEGLGPVMARALDEASHALRVRHFLFARVVDPGVEQRAPEDIVAAARTQLAELADAAGAEFSPEERSAFGEPAIHPEELDSWLGN